MNQRTTQEANTEKQKMHRLPHRDAHTLKERGERGKKEKAEKEQKRQWRSRPSVTFPFAFL